MILYLVESINVLSGVVDELVEAKTSRVRVAVRLRAASRAYFDALLEPRR